MPLTARSSALHLPTIGPRPGPVLVVDDDPAILRIITLTLADEGYTVLTATNGREALATITAQQPALVLLDLQMPEMGGWELVEHLRALDLLVPIVLMTASYRESPAAERYSVADYLPKPFDLIDLLQVVARFVA